MAATIRRCWPTWNVLCTFLYTGDCGVDGRTRRVEHCAYSVSGVVEDVACVYFYCLAQGLVMGFQRYSDGIWGGLPAPRRPFDIGGQERGKRSWESSSCSSSARTPSICSSAYAVIAALVMLAPVLARAS
jgi:hypothetical protein